jgi:hypothetical protein
MFDDVDWVDTVRTAQTARCHAWLAQVQRPVVIELGAGLNIPTVRHFSRRIVRQHQGALVRINPREAATGSLEGVGLAAGALASLTAIGQALAMRRAGRR